MNHLTWQRMYERHLMLDRRGFAISLLQPVIEMLDGSNDLVDIRYDFVHVVTITNTGGLLHILLMRKGGVIDSKDVMDAGTCISLILLLRPVRLDTTLEIFENLNVFFC